MRYTHQCSRLEGVCAGLAVSVYTSPLQVGQTKLSEDLFTQRSWYQSASSTPQHSSTHPVILEPKFWVGMN